MNANEIKMSLARVANCDFYHGIRSLNVANNLTNKVARQGKIKFTLSSSERSKCYVFGIIGKLFKCAGEWCLFHTDILNTVLVISVTNLKIYIFLSNFLCVLLATKKKTNCRGQLATRKCCWLAKRKSHSPVWLLKKVAGY